MRWDREVVWLHLLSDALIALAYYSIPVALAYFVWRRKDIAFRGMFVLFGAFIFACGTTHVMSVYTLYEPVYRLEGVIKAITAVVSVCTAFLMWPMIPRALALPSPAQLEAANRELAHQVRERETADVRIRQLNAELEQRVRERTEELRKSCAETETRTAEMEQFIYTISHDLRSPLVTVQGFAGLLERDVREGRTERLTDYVAQIKSGVVRMAELIDALLNLGRVSHLARPREPVDLADLTRKIVHLHAAEIGQKHVTVDVQDTMPTLLVDKSRIADVIESLVDNALKHGTVGSDTAIRIGAVEAEEEVRYFVKDQGPGIPSRYHFKVFDLFERLDSNSEGTGVGLAIVKRAMEVHGGRAWVESTPGQGATFWVSFPRSLLAPPSAQQQG